jgi:hypothetical protein
LRLPLDAGSFIPKRKFMKRQRAIIFLVCVSLAWCSCNDLGETLDHSDIVDPYARWRSYGFTDYEMLQTHNCFCAYRGPYKVIVRANRVVSVIDPSNGLSLPREIQAWFKTVDELFAIIRTIDPGTVAAFTVEYDQLYGIPSFFVDPSAQMADEEYGYSVTNFLPLTRYGKP